jgi:hypothetical protein
MKIFISMPMKSKSTEQVRVEMQKVFDVIKNRFQDPELVDSIIEGADKDIALKGNDVAIWYLGESIKRMAEADIVFFVNDWQDFRGCSSERKIAEAYGKYCVEIKV